MVRLSSVRFELSSGIIEPSAHRFSLGVPFRTGQDVGFRLPEHGGRTLPHCEEQLACEFIDLSRARASNGTPFRRTDITSWGTTRSLAGSSTLRPIASW